MITTTVLCAPAPYTKNTFNSLPGFNGPLSSTQHSGFVLVNETLGGHLFYWLMESQNDPVNDPTLVFLSGGPGCSSSMAAIYENGPYLVNDDGSALAANEWSWNARANLVFIDQPLGTGFSKMEKPFGGYVHTEAQIAEYMWIFFQQFFGNNALFASIQRNPLFLFAESYGGHYALAIADRINAGNDALGSGQVRINLAGIAMGNAMSDTVEQYAGYAPFALGRGLIDGDVYEQAQKMYPACQKAVEGGQYAAESAACNGILELVLEHAGPINTYDVTKTCDPALPLCYNFTGVTNYLNRADVQQTLGVDTEWTLCSSRVHLALTKDWFSSQAYIAPSMLKRNQSITAYAGVDGFIVNFLGVRNWVRNVQWDGQQAYQTGDRSVWMVDGTIAGYVLNSGSFPSQGLLQQVDVMNAGHMVPHDQHKNSFYMVDGILNHRIDWSTHNV